MSKHGHALANDSLRSLTAGLGDPSRDKSASVEYAQRIYSDEELSNAYRESWTARKIVDIPALDSLRKWRDWQADEKDIALLEKAEARLGIQNKMVQCKKWARLWGGAGIYIGTADSDPSLPLEPERMGKNGLKYLTVFSRRDLICGELEKDPFIENYGRPSYYEIAVAGDTLGSLGSSGVPRIHPSRIILQIGSEHPDPWRNTGMSYGWGDSVLQATFDAMKNADSSAANVASLLFEANVDVFGVPDFMSNLSDPAYEKRIIDRFTLANVSKSINRSLIHDSEETYERKQVSFASLAELVQQFLMIVSGAADIPVTRFLSQSPGGLNATGEGDMANYHDKIQSIQTLEIGPAMHIFDECLIRSTFGSRPEDITYLWSPLEQMSEKEIAEIGNLTATTVSSLVQSGVFTGNEMREAAITQLSETGVFPNISSIATQKLDDFGFGENGKEEEANPEEKKKVVDATPRSLYVYRKVKNSSDIYEWAKSQGMDNLVPSDDLHVTIIYSEAEVDWLSIGESFSSEIEIKKGGPRVMERFGSSKDVVVLGFRCDELNWRHTSIKHHFSEADQEKMHSPYNAHISLTYNDPSIDISKIKPYHGEIHLGPEIFEEASL